MTYGIRPRTRRDFLAGLAGSALAPLEARTSIYRPQLAAQTTVWLPLPDNLEPIFSGIRRAGYSRVVLTPEFTWPVMRPSLVSLLHRYQLEPTIVQLTGDVQAQYEAARLLHVVGALYVEVIPPPQGSALHLQAAEFERLGLRLLLREGSDTACGTWLDVEALAHGGRDPAAAIDHASATLDAVTLRSRLHGELQEEVGSGEPDMMRIADMLRRIRYDGLLVVDLPVLPARTQTICMALSHSRWYLQEVFGEVPGAAPVDLGPHVRTRRK